MKKKVNAIILLYIWLCVIFAGCSQSNDGPPEELWYLGGAPILEKFKTSGGPGDSELPKSDIIIYVPLDLVEEGFSAAILGERKDGETVDLLHGTILTPGTYYPISKDTYQEYTKLSLHVTYLWNGKMMSMRVIDLFAHKDLVSALDSNGI